MEVQPVSLVNQLAIQAADTKSQSVGAEISAAIVRQIQDQQKAYSDALLEMIKQAPKSAPVGSYIDIRA
ncbi:MAG: hypothetical protein MUO76_12555 [Anaerolineaceae bacterium]|nr:hypothetical protein [Anaerolineaceae bacterium]